MLTRPTEIAVSIFDTLAWKSTLITPARGDLEVQSVVLSSLDGGQWESGMINALQPYSCLDSSFDPCDIRVYTHSLWEFFMGQLVVMIPVRS